MDIRADRAPLSPRRTHLKPYIEGWLLRIHTVRERNCVVSVALVWQLDRKRQPASHKEMTMPALILWLLGVPLSVIILLYLIF